MSRPSFSDLPAVFPDWSPYPDLESAARAYLRDPDIALDAMAGVLRGQSVLGFTLERFVNDVNGVWQEVVVCDGTRLILWHGEDIPPEEAPPGSMTSSLRVVALSAVTEVGCRRRISRNPNGTHRVDSVDVYLLLTSLDEANVAAEEAGSSSATTLCASARPSTTAGGADRAAGGVRPAGELPGRQQPML